MPSDDVYIKAQRLLDEGRVEPYTATEAFAVQGSSDTPYVVVVGPDVSFCSCPATVKCSHVIAAERWREAERGAREGTAEAALLFSEYVRRLADRYEEVGS